MLYCRYFFQNCAALISTSLSNWHKNKTPVFLLSKAINKAKLPKKLPILQQKLKLCYYQKRLYIQCRCWGNVQKNVQSQSCINQILLPSIFTTYIYQIYLPSIFTIYIYHLYLPYIFTIYIYLPSIFTKYILYGITYFPNDLSPGIYNLSAVNCF